MAICQMVFAVGIGFVPSINFFFLGGCPLEKGRSQMSWWRRWGKRREYTILLQLFQSAAESYAERSSSPGCLSLAFRQDIDFAVLASSSQGGYLLSFFDPPF